MIACPCGSFGSEPLPNGGAPSRIGTEERSSQTVLVKFARLPTPPRWMARGMRIWGLPLAGVKTSEPAMLAFSRKPDAGTPGAAVSA